MRYVRGAALRWVHLLLGGALLMPYFLLSGLLLGLTVGGVDFTSVRWQFAAYALSLVMVAVTGFFGLVRPLSVAAVVALLKVRPQRLADTTARSLAARGRAASWLCLHTGLGTLVSGMTLSIPPAVIVLIALPLTDDPEDSPWAWSAWLAHSPPWLPPLAGLALLAFLLLAGVLVGLLLRRLAPVMLGPTPADRLAAAEQRAARLAERNRVARELHDSVGHALSTVTLQAGAARKLLERDPRFAEEALEAIEETSRQAVAELDSVLGILREDPERPGPERTDGAAAGGGPTLGSLGALVARTRVAGVEVTLSAPDGLDRLPPALSQEAYRIVQEGLTNATRHASRVPVHIELTLTQEELVILVENDLTTPPPPGAHGGRGLAGITERAVLLGGGAEAGPRGGRWQLRARLPRGGSR